MGSRAQQSCDKDSFLYENEDENDNEMQQGCYQGRHAAIP